MPPPKRQRFLKTSDYLEAKRAREEKSIEECARLDLDDSPDIADSNEKRREGARGIGENWDYSVRD
jgi:hypothetical protein